MPYTPKEYCKHPEIFLNFEGMT